MDNSRRIGSSDGQGDQGRQSTSPERQDRPETPSERESRHMRFLRSVPSDSPSTSNTDHPMPASAGPDQPGDQDHPQPERWQDMLRNILLSPIRSFRSSVAAIMDFYRDDFYLYEYLWDNPEGSISNRERIEEMLNINLDKVKNEEWFNFSINILDEANDIKELVYLGDIVRGHTADLRTPPPPKDWEKEKEETKHETYKKQYEAHKAQCQAYKLLQDMVRSAWEKKHAGALLDKDLSEVPTKTWLQFSHELLAEHEGEYGKDSDSYRYLKDILQGRIARRVPNDEGCSTTPVSDDERKSPKYQDLLPLARDKVNELLKQLNNDREPQHHDQE